MTTLYTPGLTIVETKANLPSAVDYPGFALINSTNSIVTSDGASWSNEVVTAITPEHFGAVGDGTTDDSTAMLAAVTYCSQTGVKLISDGSKSYRLATAKTLDRTGHKYLNIDLGGATIFCDNASLKFTMPATFLTTTMTTEVTRGRSYLDLTSVTGIVPGDFIEIICPYKSGPDHADSLHYYVAHELIGNKIYIEGATVADISVAQIVASGGTGTLASFTVNVYHLNEPINWVNTNLIVSDTAGVITGALEFNGCKQVWLDNFTVDGHCRTQIYIRRNAYDMVSDSTFKHFGYTNDIGTVAPLVSGSPNAYGYGILRERNWISKTVNCVGKHGWHTFDDTYGQMHSFYSDCVSERVAGGFSTHNGVWNVYYDNCTCLGNQGFNMFRACYVTLRNCKVTAETTALTLSAINHEVLIENCQLHSTSVTSQVISVDVDYTSSNRDPRTVNPSAASVGFPIRWRMIGNSLESNLTSPTWSFGIDNVNADSVLLIKGNIFYNIITWASSNGTFHAFTKIVDNLFHGSVTSQFALAPSVYPVNSGATWLLEGNKMFMGSALANGALLYLLTPTANFTLTLRRNTVDIPSLAGLVRLNTGGTCNIDYCEDNISNGRLFFINTASATTLNITNLNNNITTGAVNNSTTGLTVTNKYSNINRSVQVLQPSINWAATAPTTGTYVVGDIVYNSAPAASGTIGWVCITAGTPGTWKTFGAISA